MRALRPVLLVVFAFAIATPLSAAQGNDGNVSIPTPPPTGDPALDVPEEATDGGSVLLAIGIGLGAAALAVGVLLLSAFASWRAR